MWREDVISLSPQGKEGGEGALSARSPEKFSYFNVLMGVRYETERSRFQFPDRALLNNNLGVLWASCSQSHLCAFVGTSGLVVGVDS